MVIFLFNCFFTNIFLHLACKENIAHVTSFMPKNAILASLAHVASNELKIAIFLFFLCLWSKKLHTIFKNADNFSVKEK